MSAACIIKTRVTTSESPRSSPGLLPNTNRGDTMKLFHSYVTPLALNVLTGTWKLTTAMNKHRTLITK
jgi:hypothetical protein